MGWSPGSAGVDGQKAVAGFGQVGDQERVRGDTTGDVVGLVVSMVATGTSVTTSVVAPRGTSSWAVAAIVVEAAKSPDTAPIIIQAYGLSGRERDVVRAIARGLSTGGIAA